MVISILSSLFGEMFYNLDMANHNSYTRSFYLNGDMLRSILKCRHVSQLKLAEQIGVGKNTIYRAINLNRMESKNDFDSMCQYLDISPYLLLDKNPYIGEEEYLNVITPENVGDFLSFFDYDGYKGQSFSDVYIHQFLKNESQSSDFLAQYPEIEKFLFKKIIEKRDEYIELFGDYYFEKIYSILGQKDKTFDTDGVYDEFVDYFNQHSKEDK